jgi:hypothetical protein
MVALGYLARLNLTGLDAPTDDTATALADNLWREVSPSGTAPEALVNACYRTLDAAYCQDYSMTEADECLTLDATLDLILTAAGVTLDTPADLIALCDRLRRHAALDAALARADEKHGRTRDYTDGTGCYVSPYGIAGKPYRVIAVYMQAMNDSPTTKHYWMWKLLEEVFEAGAESDPERLQSELLDVITVCRAWMRAIDERPNQVTPENSTIDGEAVTPEEWADYYVSAATVVMQPNGSGHLRTPHATDDTFHRVRPNKEGYMPKMIDGVWCWVKP